MNDPKRCPECQQEYERTPSGFSVCPSGHGKLQPQWFLERIGEAAAETRGGARRSRAVHQVQPVTRYNQQKERP